MVRRRPRQSRLARRPKLRGLPINSLLPNVLTTLALCAGLTAIRFAVEGRWEPSVLAILIAAILDGLDGRLARLLKGASKFGAELDSLADFISFGVAPALMLYLWVLHDAGGFGWIAALAFAVCAALRLARFNTKLGESDLPSYAFNYFTGVPAPAAAGLVLLPLMMSFEVGPWIVGHPVPVVVWTLVVAVLMISPLPTYSFKGLRVPQAYIIPVLAIIGFLAAALVSAPWPTLTLVGFAYLASLPYSYRQYQRLRAKAEKLHAGLIDDLGTDDLGEVAADEDGSGPSSDDSAGDRHGARPDEGPFGIISDDQPECDENGESDPRFGRSAGRNA